MSKELEHEMKTHPNCQFYGSAVKEVLTEKDAWIAKLTEALETIQSRCCDCPDPTWPIEDHGCYCPKSIAYHALKGEGK